MPFTIQPLRDKRRTAKYHAATLLAYITYFCFRLSLKETIYE